MLAVAACACVILVSMLLPHYIGRRAIIKVQHHRKVLESNINSEIPKGADKSKVLAFLDSQAVRHTDYETANEDPTALALLGAPAVIEARVPVRTLSLTRYSIHITFKFDSKGHFSSYTDKVESTFY